MIHTLELPWAKIDEFKETYGLKMMKGGIAVYSGALLPVELRRFASEDFSYARWIEDERNATVMPPEAGQRKFSPTAEEQEVIATITQAYDASAGGFFIGEKRGAGKKELSLASIAAVARKAGFGNKSKGKLLIVCPKGYEARWRDTLHSYPVATSILRVLVVNYSQLSKLLMAPPQARITKKASAKSRQTARRGDPTINWDFVIFDEAQALRGYPRSKTALEAAAVAKLNKAYEQGRSPFVVFNSPAPGVSPLDFALMARLLGPTLMPEKTSEPFVPERWADDLASIGFTIVESRHGPVWVPEPRSAAKNTPQEVAKREATRRKETVRLARALKNSPLVSTRPHGVPTSPLLAPLTLTGSQKANYDELWLDLKQELDRGAAGDPVRLRQALGKYKQRLGYIKLDSVLEEIVSSQAFGASFYLRVSNPQVAARAEEKLLAKKITALDVTGLMGQELKIEADRFLEEEVQVLITARGLGELAESGLKGRKGFSPIFYLLDVQNGENLTDETLWLKAADVTPLVYLPYLPRSIEEKFVKDFLEQGWLSPKVVENELRTAAAKSTARNRMS